MRRALAAAAWALTACSGGTSGVPRNVGEVTITSSTFGTPGQQTYTQVFASASFIANEVGLQGCATRTFGACRAQLDCQPQLGHDPDAGTTHYAAAGLITISGGFSPITLDVMTAGMFPGQYNVYNYYMPVYVSGMHLAASAPGAEAPPFTLTVDAPAEVTMTAPRRPLNGGALTVPRALPLDFTWTGGNGGTLELALFTQMPPSAINCSFPAGAGSGRVDPAALAVLSTGPAQLSLTQSARVQTTVRDWTIGLTAGTTPTDATGYNYQLAVTLQ